jgi:hypothetical protein
MKLKPSTRILIAFFILAIILTPQVMATPFYPCAASSTPSFANETCDKLCAEVKKIKDKKNSNTIVIDASTGKMIGGSTKYPDGTDVQVLIINKNPFKYTYDVQVLSQPLSSAIAATFLGFIFGQDILGQLTPGVQGAVGLDAACGDADRAKYNELDAKINEYGTISANLLAKIKPKQEALTAVNEAYNKLMEATKDDIIACETVCPIATAFREAFKKTDFAAIGKDLDSIETDVADLKTKVSALERSVAEFLAAQTTCNDEAKKFLTDNVAKLKKEVEAYEKSVKEIKDKVKMIPEMNKIVEEAIYAENAPQAWAEIFYPPTSGEPTGVDITIKRKNRRIENATEQAFPTVKVNVGESPISLSAGIGFSTIPDRRIVRQTGLVDDGNGGTKLAPIFGFDNDSTFKPSGVIMLNAHLLNFKKKYLNNFSMGPSTGLVVSSRNGTTELEFIAGWSFGFLRNNVFLTAGFHAGRVEKLADGFKINMEIPADLEGDIPLQRDWKKGAMFSITYKLR